MVKYLLNFILLLPLSTFASERELGNIVQYGLGIYGSIYIHELGHATVAALGGATEIDIDVPRKGAGWLSGNTHLVFPDEDLAPIFKQTLDAAGLISANLASEIVIQKHGLHSNPFAQSISATSQISNLIHIYSYYTKIRGKNGYAGNDIDHFEIDGGNPHILSAVLVGYSIWSLKRMGEKKIGIYGFECKF